MLLVLDAVEAWTLSLASPAQFHGVPVFDARQLRMRSFVCAPVSCSAVSWWVCRVRDILGKGLKLEDPGCKGFTEDLQRTKTFLLSCDINLGHQVLRTCSALSNCKTQSPNLKSEEEGQPVGSDVLTDE